MVECRPAWSVVIPVYNKALYIEATLRSVLAQTEPDFEIVAVDDGSCDASAAIIEAVLDPRIRLIRQANGGVSAARNAGVRSARGEFIAFLDGDDLYHPECLARLSALSRRYPAVNVLAGGYRRVPHELMAGERFEALSADAGELIHNLPACFLRVGMPFVTSSVAVRRELLQGMSVCFPAGEAMGEDLDLWFRLAELGPIAYTPAQLVIYRIGIGDSLMGAYRGAELLPVWQRMRQRAMSGCLSAAVRRSSLRVAAEAEVTLARKLLRMGKRAAVWRHLLAARHAAGGHRWWLTLMALTLRSSFLTNKLR